MTLPKKTVNKLEVLVVIGVILLGSFLRLYRFRQTLMFQGDQGRDALIVKEMIKDGNLTLLGPVTSVGNMYLGPFYYYFMAPFLWLTYPDPIGPAYGVALVNIILLWFIYLVAKEMFGKVAGILSLFIYALMVPAIIISRFSWNPNLAPMASLLIIWTLYRFWEKKQFNMLLLSGLALGILAQLHYMALIMAMVAILVYLFALWQYRGKRVKLLKTGLVAGLVFASTWIPLLIFNSRHDNLIFNGFISFFQSNERHLAVTRLVTQTAALFEGNAYRVIVQLVSYPSLTPVRLVIFGILICFVMLLYRKIKWYKDRGLMIVLLTLGLTIIGISIYSGSIFDHYLGFVFPAVALFWGYFLTLVYRLNRVIGPILVIFSLGVYASWTIPASPIFNRPGPQVDNFQRIASDIAPQIGQGKYNLVLISESKDYKGMNYRYFLNTLGKPAAKVDDYDNLTELVVIDELAVPDPLAVQIYEIQRPQLKNLMNQFDVPLGPKIYLYN